MTAQPSSSSSSSCAVTTDTLAAFSDAWNHHDIDALMSFMTPDCIFQTAAGPDACGTRHTGTEAVRKAGNGASANFSSIAAIRETLRACNGSRIETDGIDVFTFKDGKIHLKNVFRKARPNLPAAK